MKLIHYVVIVQAVLILLLIMLEVQQASTNKMLGRQMIAVTQCAQYAASRALLADDRTNARRKQEGILSLSPPRDRYTIIDAQDEIDASKCK